MTLIFHYNHWPLLASSNVAVQLYIVLAQIHRTPIFIISKCTSNRNPQQINNSQDYCCTHFPQQINIPTHSFFDFATVNDIDHIINGDAGFCNVSGYHYFSHSLRRPIKHLKVTHSNSTTLQKAKVLFFYTQQLM